MVTFNNEGSHVRTYKSKYGDLLFGLVAVFYYRYKECGSLKEPSIWLEFDIRWVVNCTNSKSSSVLTHRLIFFWPIFKSEKFWDTEQSIPTPNSSIFFLLEGQMQALCQLSQLFHRRHDFVHAQELQHGYVQNTFYPLRIRNFFSVNLKKSIEN